MNTISKAAISVGLIAGVAGALMFSNNLLTQRIETLSKEVFDKNIIQGVDDGVKVYLEKKAAANKAKPKERDDSRTLPVGAEGYVAIKSNLGDMAIVINPVMVDVGANCKLTFTMLNLMAVDAADVIVKFDVATKNGTTVAFTHLDVVGVVKLAKAGAWSVGVVEIQNASVKEISALYVDSIKVGSLRAREDF